MSHTLIRQIFVLMLAVLVTAGLGLSAVQASTMSIQMMDMAPGTEMSDGQKCDGCGNPDASKGMAACVMVTCTAPTMANGPADDVLDVDIVPVHHPIQNPLLHGRNSGPDPYPPRTSDID